MGVSKRWLAWAVAPAILAGGCAQNPAPKGWLQPPTEACEDPYGAWVVVSPLDDAASVSGEFLAVQGDSVYVLETDGAVRSIATGDIHKARIAFYDRDEGDLALWGLSGTLSTASHGFALIFTAPAWILASSAITGGQTRAPLVDMEEGYDWSEVQQYARYPTGLPPGLPRVLPPKPRDAVSQDAGAGPHVFGKD